MGTDRLIPREAWLRWAMDCRDPDIRRHWYPQINILHSPPRRGSIDDATADMDRAALDAPHVVAMAVEIARAMQDLDAEPDDRMARAVRARWGAATDETLATLARACGVGRSTAGRWATQGQEWVAARIAI